MKMSLEGNQNQLQDEPTLGSVIRQYGFKVGEQVGTYTRDMIELSPDIQNDGWDVAMSFNKDIAIATLQEKIESIKNNNSDIKISTVIDQEANITYVLLSRDRAALYKLENIPQPVLLTPESIIPENVSRLNMSQELQNLLYTDTTKVKEKDQLATLIKLGHHIVFQPVGEHEGLYYLEKESAPEFTLESGLTLQDAIKRIKAHIKNNGNI
jgi:hypothetical protein